MKHSILLLFSIVFLLVSCNKKDGSPGSGTVTIDNKLYGSGPYYSLGFSFAEATKVSTLAGTGPDITIDVGVVETDGDVVAFLASNTYNPSFFIYGEYANATDAATAFKSLTSFSNGTWSDFGTPLASNQVWIFRTEDDTYAKILILSVTLDTAQDPDYASCSFKWVYQPDGTKTFPE
jgi:hypothetical protein